MLKNGYIHDNKMEQNFSDVSMSYPPSESQLKMMHKSAPNATPNSRSQIHTPKEEIISLKPSVLD